MNESNPASSTPPDSNSGQVQSSAQPLPTQPILVNPVPGGSFTFPPGQAGMMLGLSQQSWQGPYPPPDAAERFEVLHPGAFARILTMAETEQTARIASVNAAQGYMRNDVARGHWLGFSVSISALVAAVACAVLGYPWVGACCVGVPVLAVAQALVQTARRVPVTPSNATPLGTPTQSPPSTPATQTDQNQNRDGLPSVTDPAVT